MTFVKGDSRVISEMHALNPLQGGTGEQILHMVPLMGEPEGGAFALLETIIVCTKQYFEHTGSYPASGEIY